jgi:histidinol-phosphate aminotransferase
VTVAATTSVRLHLGENPLGCAPAARQAAARSLERTSTYPDPGRRGLIAALAAHARVTPAEVVVGNGSDELVLLSSFSVGAVERPGLTTAATFPGYRICLESVGRGCTEVPLAAGRLDVDRFIEALPAHGVAYVCNPHNPTGAALTRAELDRLVAAAAATGVPLILDEAYQEFAPAGTPSAHDYLGGEAPLLSLRTFSKAYGLAGLRVGYAIGAASVIERLRRVQQTIPFSVNRVAQEAAIAALADGAFLEEVRRRTAAQRAWFCAELDRGGHRYLPSVTNFVTVAVPGSAAAERALETEHGILARDTGRFGLPDHLRVSLGATDDLRALLEVLEGLAPGAARTGTER